MLPSINKDFVIIIIFLCFFHIFKSRTIKTIEFLWIYFILVNRRLLCIKLQQLVYGIRVVTCQFPLTSCHCDSYEMCFSRIPCNSTCHLLMLVVTCYLLILSFHLLVACCYPFVRPTIAVICLLSVASCNLLFTSCHLLVGIW